MADIRRHRNHRRGPTGSRIVAVSATVPRNEKAASENLHVCPACGSELVQPRRWSPAGSSHWRVERRCPECDWEGRGVFEQRILDRYDEVLSEGATTLIDELDRLERANMAEQIECFVAALQAHHILPEDF